MAEPRKKTNGTVSDRSFWMKPPKEWGILHYITVSLLISTGVLSYNVTDVVPFLGSKKVVQKSVWTLSEKEELIKNVNTSIVTMQNHVKNENLHMGLAVKDQRYVTWKNYEKDMRSVDHKLDLLIANAIAGSK